ncbi:MAG: hypothetical protein Q4E02_02030 [Lagierella massiliensis]|nr:hypothetical protein [Lagierella massiliensis]
MKKRVTIFLFLLLFTVVSCKRQEVVEVQEEEYKIREMDVGYSVISYKLPVIKEEHEILKAYRNMLYILIHDVISEETGEVTDCLMLYDFQSEKEVRRYDLNIDTKIHDLVVYQSDIYISFGNGEDSYFEESTESEKEQINTRESNILSTEFKEGISENTNPTGSYFDRVIDKKYFLGKIDEEGLSLIKSLESQRFAPKFLEVFGEIYYSSMEDRVYKITPLLDQYGENEFYFDFADEMQESICSNGNLLIAQGKEGKQSFFYIVDKDFQVEKIPIESSEQFFSFVGLRNGIFSSFTDIFDRESLKLMYVDINAKGEETYKKKIVSSEHLYKFYSNNMDDIVAVDSTGVIKYILIKGNQIYMGNVKGIGDNKYKILINKDSRYGFLDEELGVYLDIYFN